MLEKWNLERIFKSQRHFPSIRVFAQQETVEFAELDEIRAHRTARQRRSCIARLEGPAKGRGQAASGLTSERMFCGCPASMAKQAAASITVIDIEILSAMRRLSAQIVIVHQKTVGNPGIDPLQRTSLFIQALPFECGMRQFTKISKMIRIHFDAHHSGLGTGGDVAQTITLVSTLALEIIDRRRTGPLERAALFFVALIMHRPDLLACRTLAVKIAMFGSKQSVKLVFIQGNGWQPEADPSPGFHPATGCDWQ